MPESAGVRNSPVPRWTSILVITVIVALLFIILFPLIDHVEQTAYRSECAHNLDQIGKVYWAWTLGSLPWPNVFKEGSKSWYDVGNTRTDQWNPVENEGQPPASRPGDNGRPIQSNTANLWILIASGMAENPALFICPSTRHAPDAAMADFSKVRDFRGETFCSYSLQNLLENYTMTWTQNPNLVVAADANPMRRDFWSGAPGGGKPGVTDKKLAEKPLFEDEDWKDKAGPIQNPWELNSPNHNFKGQNVLYFDGRVEWQNNPYCGVNYDNIWLRRRTDAAEAPDPKDIESVRAYNDVTSYDGTSTLPVRKRYDKRPPDSFLVP